MALVNIWHLRKVAEASAKPCDICYKPTTSVLITPDKQDWFHICQAHVKDRGFCTPIVNEAEVAAQKKKEMDQEMERIQKEYEEKMKRKLKDEDNHKKEKGKDENKEKEGEKKTNPSEDKAEKERIEKISELAGQAIASKVEEMPRIFELHKVFYQKRLDRKRNAELAKRDRDRLNALKNPTLFPSVPRNNLG